MTIADLLILVAALLPYVTVAYAKYLVRGEFDNARPRDNVPYSGTALRAYNAHLNGFETFPLFAIAVLYSELHGMSPNLVTMLAAVYIALRLLYIAFYISNKPTYRSLVFTLSLIVACALFLLPLFFAPVYH